MPTFLTVKEAATRTGKSPSSIRRIIYPIIADEKHADRTHVEPSVEDVVNLRMRGENFAWRISDELLLRAVPVEPASPAPASSRSAASVDAELVAMLRRELDTKNQQIAEQMQLMRDLGERLREGNVLLGALQQRLALPGGRRPHSEGRVHAKHPISTSEPKRSKVSPKPIKPKRRLWSFFTLGSQ